MVRLITGVFWSLHSDIICQFVAEDLKGREDLFVSCGGLTQSSLCEDEEVHLIALCLKVLM